MKRKSPEGSKYPDNWKEIAKAVKDEADWKCVRCGKLHDPENGYTLTVHHLDINPENSAWWNLAPLCQRCHLSIQSKVIMERPYMFSHSEWFRPYVAAYYGVIAGRLHPTKNYLYSLVLVPRYLVEKQMDDLLTIDLAFQPIQLEALAKG
jgi:hypothetical protein